MMQDPHASASVKTAGATVTAADLVVIMLHGRGASAGDILRLAPGLVAPEHLRSTAFIAPQAANNVWYPQSGFLPQDQLQPWLDSSLSLLDRLIDDAIDNGVDPSRIVLAGFSQGAMLSLEYASRGRREIGGVIAFSGSLIGPVDQEHAPLADVSGLRMFIGCGTNDSWIPARAAETTAGLFTAAGADVDLRIYDGMEHTINDDELSAATALTGALVRS